MRKITSTTIECDDHEYELIRNVIIAGDIRPNLNALLSEAYNDGVSDEKLSRSRDQAHTEKAQEVFGQAADDEIEGLKESLKEHRETVINQEAVIKHLREALEEMKREIARLEDQIEGARDFRLDLESDHKKIVGSLDTENKKLKGLNEVECQITACHLKKIDEIESRNKALRNQIEALVS